MADREVLSGAASGASSDRQSRVCLIDYLYEVAAADGNRVYIGRTAYPKVRAKRHGDRWPNGIFRILAIGDHEYIANLEKNFIRHLRERGIRLANVADGGDNPPSGLGRSWSPEKRAKLEAIMREPEYRAHMSARLKGRPKPEGHGAKVSAALRHKSKSLAHRAKLSEVRAGKSGHPHTAESKSKIAAANRRRSYSAETRVKISTSLVKSREYRSAYFKGRTFSDETRRKMSLSARRRWNKLSEQEAGNP